MSDEEAYRECLSQSKDVSHRYIEFTHDQRDRDRNCQKYNDDLVVNDRPIILGCKERI